MRALCLVALLSLMAWPARAEPPKLAVFDFEMIDYEPAGRGERAASRRAGAADARRRSVAQGAGRIPASSRSSILRPSMPPRTAAICRPAAAATSNTRANSAPTSPSPAWCKRFPTSSSTSTFSCATSIPANSSLQ